MELHLGNEDFLQESSSGVISTALRIPSPPPSPYPAPVTRIRLMSKAPRSKSEINVLAAECQGQKSPFQSLELKTRGSEDRWK